MISASQALSQTKDLAIILAGIIALFGFINGLLEYTRQGSQNRAQQFVEMRRRFMENATFREICNLLATDDPRLQDMAYQEKRNFGGFLEELALMVNAGVLRIEVAHYMFGYYAIQCWESENFWSNLDRNSIYWSLFRDFVRQLKECETNFRFDRKRLRF